MRTMLIPSRAAAAIALGAALIFVMLMAASIPGVLSTLPSLADWECDAQHNAAVSSQKFEGYYEVCKTIAVGASDT
jgi:hypothetical protein